MKQEIHFVTGKGGVGKSVVAAALALRKSQEGKKVLLVELGDQSFFKDFFNLPHVGYVPVTLRKNLSLALWSGGACLQEYARHLIKVETLARLFFENTIMRAFINIAPGLPELAILGKVTSGQRGHGPVMPYDCLVVDAYATGHFLALMEAPFGMSQAIQFGPMGEQSRGISSCLRDQSFCHYHVVSLPEELPFKEAAELIKKLNAGFGVTPHLVMNKILSPDLPFESLKLASSENSDVGQFAKYLHEQMKHQRDILSKVSNEKIESKQIPLFLEDQSWPLIELIAGTLT